MPEVEYRYGFMLVVNYSVRKSLAIILTRYRQNLKSWYVTEKKHSGYSNDRILSTGGKATNCERITLKEMFRITQIF